MEHGTARAQDREAPSLRKRAGAGKTPESAAGGQSATAKAGKRRARRIEVAPADGASPGKERVKKQKVVRDTFTMPRSDYDKIKVLLRRCLDAGVEVKKGELLRAGLILLESAPPKQLLAAVASVERIRTGRPPKLR